MDKREIKNILMNMRTQENGTYIDFLLGKIDGLEEKSIQSMLEKIGRTEEDIQAYVKKEISRRHQTRDEKFPINEMFTYGITGSSIHLHLPGDLHPMFTEKGMSTTMDTVNLYLLDAIERIRQLKDSGFYRFQEQDSIYMISPILLPREMKFLESMDFETHSYRKKDLRDQEFLKLNPEAGLAVQIFGENRNVGTARIAIETIRTKEWQDKRNEKIKEFNQKGITMGKSSKEKE